MGNSYRFNVLLLLCQLFFFIRIDGGIAGALRGWEIARVSTASGLFKEF
jgi:hypothetical protein